jgi:siroheme synthase
MLRPCAGSPGSGKRGGQEYEATAEAQAACELIPGLPSY